MTNFDFTGHRIRVFAPMPDDDQRMFGLQQKVYAPIFGPGGGYLHAAQMRSHITHFPHGQFIALDTDTDTVIALSLTMLTDIGPERVFDIAWHVITDKGMITNHNPTGEWLYGVESCVLPEYRGRGVYSALMRARFDIVRQMNLRGITAGGLIYDYHQSPEVPAEQYVNEVINGTRFDTNLTKQLKLGFKVVKVMPDYFYYPPSLDYGVALLWENPDYDPTRPVQTNVTAPEYEWVLGK